MIVTDHLGNKYKSIREMCKHYGVSYTGYKSRISRGWTIEKALTTFPNSVLNENNIHIHVDHLGNTFLSLSAMCKHYGISTCRYQKRLAKGMSLEEILTGDDASVVYDHVGNKYESLKCMLEHYEVSEGVYRRRLKKGWSLKAVLTTPVENNTTPVIDHLGNKFNSTSEMCRHWNVTRKLYRSRIKSGWSVEKALTGERRDDRIIIDHEGNEFNSNKKMAEYWGISESTLNVRIRKGMTIKEALTTPVFEYDKRKYKDHTGKVFPNKKAMCMEWGITPSAYNGRIRNGWSLEEVLTTPMNYKELGIIKISDNNYFKVSDHTGKVFSSRKEMCKYWNVPYRIFHDRIHKEGMTLEQALTTQYTGRGDYCEDHLGNKFNNKKEMAEYWGIPYMVYIDRCRERNSQYDTLEKF